MSEARSAPSRQSLQMVRPTTVPVDSELMLWRMPPAAAVHRIADSDTASPCRQVRSAITARSHVP